MYPILMKKVFGKPVIGYLLDNLSYSKKIDKIVLAIPKGKKDNILSNYAESLGYFVFRGDEDNVLKRYYDAAVEYKAENILRLTGDCPLIDPIICDKFIEYFLKEKADFASLSSRYAEGLDCEALTFNALETSYKKAKKRAEKEHVTFFIKRNPDLFKVKILDNSIDDSKYRITIDTKEDFEVFKNIIKNLKKSSLGYYPFSKVKEYLDKDKNTFKKNSKMIRNEWLIEALKE